MNYIKKYGIFNESNIPSDRNIRKNDNVYSDRDKTNLYYCEKGWVRFTKYHTDSYIEIESKFGITYKELGDILLEFVDTFDLNYSCRTDDDTLAIDLDPSKFEEVGGHSGVDFEEYMRELGCNVDSDDPVIHSGIGDILFDIDESLEKYNLTIKSTDSGPSSQGYDLYITSSQITLIISKI